MSQNCTQRADSKHLVYSLQTFRRRSQIQMGVEVDSTSNFFDNAVFNAFVIDTSISYCSFPGTQKGTWKVFSLCVMVYLESVYLLWEGT